jgi:hypothetical protein
MLHNLHAALWAARRCRAVFRSAGASEEETFMLSFSKTLFGLQHFSLRFVAIFSSRLNLLGTTAIHSKSTLDFTAAITLKSSKTLAASLAAFCQFHIGWHGVGSAGLHSQRFSCTDVRRSILERPQCASTAARPEPPCEYPSLSIHCDHLHAVRQQPGPPSQLQQLMHRLATLPKAKQKMVVDMLEGVLKKA